MSPLYVRPYVKVHKNDDRDAETIAEAATRPTMSFVAIKSEEQLDLQALHRLRERLVHNHHLIQEMRRPRSTSLGWGRCKITSRLIHIKKRLQGKAVHTCRPESPLL